MCGHFFAELAEGDAAEPAAPGARAAYPELARAPRARRRQLARAAARPPAQGHEFTVGTATNRGGTTGVRYAGDASRCSTTCSTGRAAAGRPLTLTGLCVSVRLPTGELEVLATHLHAPAAYPTKGFGRSISGAGVTRPSMDCRKADLISTDVGIVRRITL